MKLTTEQELHELKRAVRAHSHDPYLLHLVGPSEAENKEAEERLKALDALSPSCEWDQVQPSPNAQVMRRHWKRIMRQQAEYEARYC
jgi:hypothetical protein